MIQFSELRLSDDKSKIMVGCFVENFSVYDDMYIDKIYVEYYKNRMETVTSPSTHAYKIYDSDDAVIVADGGLNYDYSDSVFYVTDQATATKLQLVSEMGSQVRVSFENSGTPLYEEFRGTVVSVSDENEGRFIVTFKANSTSKNPYTYIRNDVSCSVHEALRTVHAEMSETDITPESIAEPETYFGVDKFDGGMFYVLVVCEGTPASNTFCGWDEQTTVGILIDWERIYSDGMHYIGRLASRHLACRIDDEFVDFVLRWNAFKLALETGDFESLESIWEYFTGNESAAASSCGCCKKL